MGASLHKFANLDFSDTIMIGLRSVPGLSLGPQSNPLVWFWCQTKLDANCIACLLAAIICFWVQDPSRGKIEVGSSLHS